MGAGYRDLCHVTRRYSGWVAQRMSKLVQLHMIMGSNNLYMTYDITMSAHLRALQRGVDTRHAEIYLAFRICAADGYPYIRRAAQCRAVQLALADACVVRGRACRLPISAPHAPRSYLHAMRAAGRGVPRPPTHLAALAASMESTSSPQMRGTSV